ncbi:MAG: response regulator [Tardiphaga sp.]
MSQPFKTVVLVVEDEPLLRMNTVDMVEDAGFEVVEAPGVAQALKLLESRGDISIVLSDIDMPPGMNGLELAELIRKRWPPVEVILLSGKYVPSDARLPKNHIFFSKPYRPSDVVAALHRVAS